MSKAKAANVYMYKIEHRMQICMRYLPIACNTDHVLQYRWENFFLEENKIEASLKFCHSKTLSFKTEK